LVCLDTSILIALIRKDKKAVDKLVSEAVRRRSVSTTVINLCELYSGAYASSEPSKELEKVRGLASHLELLDLDVDAARKYGELVNHPEIKAAPIGDFDLIIAAIALSHGEPLATRNIDHFARVPELQLEAW